MDLADIETLFCVVYESFVAIAKVEFVSDDDCDFWMTHLHLKK